MNIFKAIFGNYSEKELKRIEPLKQKVLALEDEVIDEKEYEIFDEKSTWKRKLLKDYYVKEMLQPIFINGKQVYKVRSVEESKEYHKQELNKIYPEVRRLFNPSKYYVDLTKKLYDLKYDLINKKRGY